MRKLLFGLGAALALSTNASANPPVAGCSTCGPTAPSFASKWHNPFAKHQSSDCGCTTSATSFGLFSKGWSHGCNTGCNTGCNSGCGHFSFNLGIWDWIKAPCPSSAPGRNMGQLAFPTHPYARSPRDYFMVD